MFLFSLDFSDTLLENNWGTQLFTLYNDYYGIYTTTLISRRPYVSRFMLLRKFRHNIMTISYVVMLYIDIISIQTKNGDVSAWIKHTNRMAHISTNRTTTSKRDYEYRNEKKMWATKTKTTNNKIALIHCTPQHTSIKYRLLLN